jgi:hypothetical protein
MEVAAEAVEPVHNDADQRRFYRRQIIVTTNINGMPFRTSRPVAIGPGEP